MTRILDRGRKTLRGSETEAVYCQGVPEEPAHIDLR